MSGLMLELDGEDRAVLARHLEAAVPLMELSATVSRPVDEEHAEGLMRDARILGGIAIRLRELDDEQGESHVHG